MLSTLVVGYKSPDLSEQTDSGFAVYQASFISSRILSPSFSTLAGGSAGFVWTYSWRCPRAVGLERSDNLKYVFGS